MAGKEVHGLYKELKGILRSLEKENSWFHDNGFVTHSNEVINRAIVDCPEINNISNYMLVTDYRADGYHIVHTTQAKQKLNSLIGRIEGQYGLEEQATNSGPTFIQNQSQSQTQHLMSLTLEMQEKIINEISKHPSGSKERSFLEKVKQSLSTVKTASDILSIALKIGTEFGLDLITVQKLLGL